MRPEFRVAIKIRIVIYTSLYVWQSVDLVLSLNASSVKIVLQQKSNRLSGEEEELGSFLIDVVFCWFLIK